MDKTEPIPRAVLAEQVALYAEVRPKYVLYARVLERTLEEACRRSIPEAVVQTRAKTISSFAEKCARKYPKYTDPVNELIDLCGGRVLVQTLDQVASVEHFIDRHFEVLEKDDKTSALEETKFGYRDLHFVVRLREDKCAALGIKKKEREEIGDLRAEIQVRTWLQHAWADLVHDRVYKSPLTAPDEIRRLVALQAALLEEGDRNFNHMADVLDEMRANYATFADREGVDLEGHIRTVLRDVERAPEAKAEHALGLARLRAAEGAYEDVVKILGPVCSADSDSGSSDIRSELGHALCRVHREEPVSAEYRRGIALLREALDHESTEWPYVIDQPRAKSRRARAHHRLARALELIPGELPAAREHHQQAHEIEPGNPYYLTAMLGSEIRATKQRASLVTMRGSIRAALDTCREHALAGIELPYALFTAGRLGLLLDDQGGRDSYDAFGYYARGIRHCFASDHPIPPGLIEEEIRWIQDLHGGHTPGPASKWVLRALELALRVRELPERERPPTSRLIVAGGAASMDRASLARVRPLLKEVLGGFCGQVISGGTTTGVPGAVGQIAARLEREGSKRFELVGYLPNRLSGGAKEDKRYDRRVRCGGAEFCPEQVLEGWSDLLDEGARPGDVTILGLGGGPISRAEYHLGLALGASVALVEDTGGTAEELLADALWDLPGLLPIPFDRAALRTLVPCHRDGLDAGRVAEMARGIHEAFRSDNLHRLPEALRPWPDLDESFKEANRAQARSIVDILEAHGFGVREVTGPGAPVMKLDRKDRAVRKMAEAEHGRWTIERLREGWRRGPRDDDAKRHDLLVPWRDLSAAQREPVMKMVLNFPRMLSDVGLEVYRA